MSTLRDVKRLTIEAVDSQLAEAIEHFPLRNNSTDPDRARSTLTGVLRVGLSKPRNAAGGNSGSWSGRISSGTAEAHINAVSAALPVIRQHDKLRAIDRIGQPFFEIVDITDRQDGRIVLHLGVA